jgi:hypothetical protein
MVERRDTRYDQMNSVMSIEHNGNTTWCDADGRLHRDDGPALEYVDGTKIWYQHGMKHRDDGPAFISADGDNEWHQHGMLHRVDGPAVIDADGLKEWWQHGKLHRDDGPAVIYAHGNNYWFLRGKKLSFDEWLDEGDMSTEYKVMMKLQYG